MGGLTADLLFKDADRAVRLNNPTLRNVVFSTAPRPLLARVLQWRRRPMLDAFRQAKALFIHVPRSAGTSISTAVFKMWIDHFTMREHLDSLPEDVLMLPRFAVVRNPWDRAVSAWSFARAGGGPENAVLVRQPELYRDAAFSTFERFALEWLPTQRPAALDPIFRPQTHFLFDHHARLALAHLGRIEALGETAQWLAEVTGRPHALPHLNASKHGQYRDYYTPASREAIAQFYAADIEAFDYHF